MVAMAIVGLGVATLLEAFSMGLRLGARSSLHTESLSQGRQVMDTYLMRKNLPDGTERGSADQRRWRLEVRPVQQDSAVGSLASPWELKEVTLEMSVGDASRGRALELKTRLLRRKQP